MVKMPRKVKRYSPAAGRHTEHTLERVKKKRASELKWGQRRFRRVTAGYRGSLDQNQKGVRSQPRESIWSSGVLRLERLILQQDKEQRNSSLWKSEVESMTGRFLRITCKDCGNESVIFERASTVINCGVCGATLAQPAGGKASLVGSEVQEVLE